MGYTITEVDLIRPFLSPGISVIDMGAQCDYTTGATDPPFISEWYKRMGVTDYTCVDLAGGNNALKVDLSKILFWGESFNIVVDCGTGEHLVMCDEYITVPFHDGYIHSVYPEESTITDKRRGFYNFWVNKHRLCKTGGKMISINPETGSWPDHCYHWINIDFYHRLVEISGYTLYAAYRSAAMGNTISGWNVVSVLEKKSESFPTYEQFLTLPIFDK